jgi:methylated-DNA-[protein]-cysteine S-methyltransferase
MAEAELGCDFIDVPEVRARLWVAFDAWALHIVHWSPAGGRAEDALGVGAVTQRALPEAFREPLARYLTGTEVDLGLLPIAPRGTPFQQTVWSALRRIPRGHVRTYAGIATEIGKPRAMRAVGSANGKNPLAIVVPCHRVVEAGMQLGGYTGGLHFKRFLLELEGVRVVSDHVQPGQLDLLTEPGGRRA